MQYVLTCPEPQILQAYIHGTQPCCSIKCTDGTNLSPPVSVPVTMGLQDLAWSDVSLLIGALILSCSLAIGFNILAKMFYRG
jgi:hypothetical protein